VTSTRFRFLGLLGAALLLLTGCKVDIRIDVDADDNGAGTIQVTVDADNVLVTTVPGLASNVRYEDLVSSGWTVEGPIQVNNGGLRIILKYAFESPAEATRALNQINGPNGPLINAELKRTVNGRQVATTLDATAQLTGGLEAFSDAALTAAIGETPWLGTARKLEIQNPSEALTITLVVRLPGDIKKTTGSESAGGVVWNIPTDGTSSSVVIGTVATRVDGGFWQLVATITGYTLGLWLMVMGLLIFFVIYARRNRSRRPPVRRPGTGSTGSQTRPINRATPDL